MSIIKVRPNRIPAVHALCLLHEPNRDALVLYARFIGDAVDYVLNQLIETTLMKDRDFVAWRAEHPHEVVMAPPRRHNRPASAATAERRAGGA